VSAPTTPGAAPVLEARSASRWYGNVVAVNDVSFHLEPGITGLLGANGAGKSTLLHLTAGLLAPSAGTVRLDGKDVHRNPEVYRTVGLVPERDAVHPFLTGFEFALLNARLHRLPRPREAAHRALALVHLEADMHRPVRSYSKGMRQRAKVAGALVHEPRVLLLDEPFNGMDPARRTTMMELLRRLAGEGCAVLISSHILEELHEIADRVLVLVAGRLAAAGPFRAIRRLMTDRPHTFTIQAGEGRRLAAALVRHPSVTAVELDGDRLTVRAADRRGFAAALPQIARDESVRLHEVRTADESLESVFSYLVER
jgi:ABC-2 type transport system ATP-binding protein